MNPTHHMFLSCRNVEAEVNFQVKWLYDDEIDQFYGDTRFQNAIAFPTPCPVRPDMAVVIAYDGNNIMGMGDIPFYGTAAANIQSQNIAIKSGFKPTWVETEAEKLEE